MVHLSISPLQISSLLQDLIYSSLIRGPIQRLVYQTQFFEHSGTSRILDHNCRQASTKLSVTELISNRAIFARILAFEDHLQEHRVKR